MNAREAIRNTIESSSMIVDSYMKDLSDEDLLIRPVSGMNHMAWQIGHLIGTEQRLVDMVSPGTSPPLPPDFNEGHGRDKFTEDDPAKFYPVARYQELWGLQRRASLALLDRLSEEDLDRTDEKFPPFAPTVGAVMNLIGTHPLMHAGQFVAVRRSLGKPVAI